MINVHEATPKEIFDFVKNHLLTQNKTAANEGPCLYRSDDGSKCAVGCLIPDDIYQRSFEGTTWDYLSYFKGIPIKSLKGALLTDLQIIHDNVPVWCWEEELDKLEKRLCLI